MANPQTQIGGSLPVQTSNALTNAMNLQGQTAAMAPVVGAAGINRGAIGNVAPQTLAGTDLTPYMNPYQQNVIDTTMNELNRQERIRQQGVNNAATAAGAFGGSRHGVQAAETARNAQQTQANVLAQLNAGNFQQAQQAATGDIGRDLTAQQINTGINRDVAFQNPALALQGLAQGAAGAQGLGNLANLGFGMGQGIQQNQLLAGLLQQQQMQRLIDSARGEWQGYSGAGDTALNRLIGVLGAQPAQGTTTQGYKPGLMDWAGLGLQGGGLALTGGFI